jgi:hypothetical protein
MLSGEDVEGVNSELRYITIELMKIAAQRKQPFAEVAREFLQNTNLLQRLIETSEGEPLTRFMLPTTPGLPRAPKMPRPPKVKPGTQ